MTTIEFFYDFGSPASYLAWTQMDRMAEESGAEIVLRPMLLGAVFKASGNATPLSVPAKGRWISADFTRWARRYGVPLRFPPNFPLNTLPLMRAAEALRGDARFDAYVRAVYDAIFGRGEDVTDPAVIGAALSAAGLDAEAIMALAQDQAAKDALKAATEEAVARGVFGAPTFFVGDVMHFGQDRIDWVVEAAKAGG